MTYIILALFCLIPFSDLFFMGKLDMWLSHGAFFQLGILACFSYSLYKPSIKPTIFKRNLINKPLASLFLWLGLTTAFWWNYTLIQSKTYNFLVFMPLFNFMCFVLLYKFIIEYLDKKSIQRILKWFAKVIGIIAVICILQLLDLDQFHKHFATTEATKYKDVLVGTIGNPMHLAGYLSICLPVLYYTNTIYSTISIVLLWFIIFMTGSFSGLIGALLVTIFYNCFHQIRFKYERLLFYLFCGISALTVYLKGWTWLTTSLLNPHGRFQFWKEIFPLFKKFPITGTGLGIMIARNGLWKHVHNEFYQIAITVGIIGLGIVIWGCLEYFKRFKRCKQDKLSVCIASMFVAFLINCFFGYPCHNYLLGMLGLFSYATMHCLEDI